METRLKATPCPICGELRLDNFVGAHIALTHTPTYHKCWCGFETKSIKGWLDHFGPNLETGIARCRAIAAMRGSK